MIIDIHVFTLSITVVRRWRILNYRCNWVCLLNRCGEHTHIYTYCILIHTVDIVLCWLVGEMDLQQSGVFFLLDTKTSEWYLKVWLLLKITSLSMSQNWFGWPNLPFRNPQSHEYIPSSPIPNLGVQCHFEADMTMLVGYGLFKGCRPCRRPRKNGQWMKPNWH